MNTSKKFKKVKTQREKDISKLCTKYALGSWDPLRQAYQKNKNNPPSQLLLKILIPKSNGESEPVDVLVPERITTPFYQYFKQKDMGIKKPNVVFYDGRKFGGVEASYKLYEIIKPVVENSLGLT